MMCVNVCLYIWKLIEIYYFHRYVIVIDKYISSSSKCSLITFEHNNAPAPI
jgi:hypothetical protein